MRLACRAGAHAGRILSSSHEIGVAWRHRAHARKRTAQQTKISLVWKDYQGSWSGSNEDSYFQR